MRFDRPMEETLGIFELGVEYSCKSKVRKIAQISRNFSFRQLRSSHFQELYLVLADVPFLGMNTLADGPLSAWNIVFVKTSHLHVTILFVQELVFFHNNHYFWKQIDVSNGIINLNVDVAIITISIVVNYVGLICI